MPHPSKPRYRVPDGLQNKRSRRELELKPQTPLMGWTRMVARFLILSTAIPYLAFRVWLLAVNPYRVFFEVRPTAVKLDGKTIPLDSANGFGLSRFTFGEHRLRYAESSGATKEVRLHPRLDDGDDSLSISDGRASGFPKADFIPMR